MDFCREAHISRVTYYSLLKGNDIPSRYTADSCAEGAALRCIKEVIEKDVQGCTLYAICCVLHSQEKQKLVDFSSFYKFRIPALRLICQVGRLQGGYSEL